MIIERKGSMFEMAPIYALVGIPVNTVGVAGRGLARWMRDRYTFAYEKYRRICKQGKMDNGDLTVIDVVEFRLAMIPTKISWTEPSEPDLIDASLQRLVEYMDAHDISEVHLPHLGCGIHTGQLDWINDVRPIIHHYFGAEDNFKQCYVYDGQ